MRKTQIFITLVLLIVLQSCNTKEALIEGSDIDTSTPFLNSTDIWLRDNYTTPYNIEVLYNWNNSRVDYNRYLYPPTLENILPAMEAIKTIWLDTYNEVAGSDFVKKIAPREILMVGGINLNQSGTITLGLAEGGKRITFFNTDLVDLKDRASLTRFVATIQHEYCHIINQTVPFDEEAYKTITPSGYTAQWFNESIADSRELGFISAYARSNEVEDFAEMVTAMLSNDNVAYNNIIDAISSPQGKADIRAKEVIVANYFKSEFNLDIYELQRVAAENVLKVLN
ncbi:putative zinc-binding metallopeptidase [Tenacibaculum ovolyticum]|uniref:substrate import-associated zinc metallohydrolase lipoprotein n=1 Tax=Tenacibaculum ovolyticum TaxID=104270 RepID=UPI0022F38C01|nr:substrate import-associated zinc metallohydrolase lipoprotein [Tenacibaculum ovolyticum]WBX76805.1 putative zinc-binding metallopeptidase [Tenacibaculum ovolyticum]